MRITYRIAAPAVGANFSFTLPREEVRFDDALLIGLSLTLATDATVANRVVRLTLTNQVGQVVLGTVSPFVQIATTTRVYRCHDFGFALPDATVVASAQVLVALPNYRIRFLDTLASAVVGLQAGDQITDINLHLDA